MGIEDIKQKIIDDAKKEVKRILKEAEKEKENAIEEAIREGEAIKEEAVKKAEKEAENISKRSISQLELERKKTFSARESKLLDELFKEAKNNIFNLDRKKLEHLIQGLILSSDAAGNEEVVFSDKLKKFRTKSFIKRLNKKANNLGRKTDFRISEDSIKDFDVVLRGENYKILLSVEDIFLDNKGKLEKKLLNILKGEGT